jgi:hypothetical protein
MYLPKLLRCVDWGDRQQVIRVHELLDSVVLEKLDEPQDDESYFPPKLMLGAFFAALVSTNYVLIKAQF